MALIITCADLRRQAQQRVQRQRHALVVLQALVDAAHAAAAAAGEHEAGDVSSRSSSRMLMCSSMSKACVSTCDECAREARPPRARRGARMRLRPRRTAALDPRLQVGAEEAPLLLEVAHRDVVAGDQVAHHLEQVGDVVLGLAARRRRASGPARPGRRAAAASGFSLRKPAQVVRAVQKDLGLADAVEQRVVLVGRGLRRGRAHRRHQRLPRRFEGAAGSGACVTATLNCCSSAASGGASHSRASRPYSSARASSSPSSAGRRSCRATSWRRRVTDR